MVYTAGANTRPAVPKPEGIDDLAQPVSLAMPVAHWLIQEGYQTGCRFFLRMPVFCFLRDIYLSVSVRVFACVVFQNNVARSQGFTVWEVTHTNPH